MYSQISTFYCSSRYLTPFRFLDLPGEIRNKIYFFALANSRPFTIKLQFGGSNTTALLRTNKQIYNEASSIFYRQNTFCLPQSLFVGSPILPQLRDFYHVSEQRLQTMTSFNFHITVSRPQRLPDQRTACR